MAAGKSGASARGAKPCGFCGIISGTQKAFVVHADDSCVAFLDYRPLALGHLLLVPLAHYPTLAEMPEPVFAALAVKAKQLSAAVMQALGAEGSFLALNNIVSQSIPHVHLHIVPRKKGDGVFTSGLVWKRVSYRDDSEREAIAARIRAAMVETTA